MNLKSTLVLSPLWVLVAVSPSLAQAYATTVVNSVVSPQGREERSNRVVKRERGNRNGFSLSTDTQNNSTNTTNRRDGVTTTTISNNGSINTAITREHGQYSKTEVFEYSESFDYADFANTNNITTGFSGERGPRRR